MPRGGFRWDDEAREPYVALMFAVGFSFDGGRHDRLPGSATIP